MRLAMLRTARLLYRSAVFLPSRWRLDGERRLRGREEHGTLRQADVVVASFGKSGRTWLRVMISGFYQKKHGISDSSLIGFNNFHRKNADVPRIFFTHDNYLQDFTGHTDSKADYHDKRVVLLARHPADTAVSQFFQWKFRMRDHKKRINGYPTDPGTDIFNFVMGEDAGIPKITRYLNLWAAEADRISDLLVIRYEDMRADAARELRRFAEFAKTPGSDEEIAHAVDYASFDNMRKMELKRTFWLAGSRMKPKDANNPQSYKVRRGKVGGFRDYFDDDQVARIETWIEENLSPFYGWTGASGFEAQAGKE